jgi:hypothetical protein
MPGFLSNIKKSEIESLYNKLHETFAKTITVYKNSQKTVVASTAAYNSVYRRTNTGSTSNIEYTTISEAFDARIYYLKSDEEYLSNDGNQQGTQNKIILPQGSVKIIVKQDAFEFIKESRKIEFDGKRFNIKSDGNPYGLTGNQFYVFYLTPIDE